MKEEAPYEESSMPDSKKKWVRKLPVFWIVIVLVAIAVLVIFLGSRNLLPFKVPFASAGIDPKTYQAVFLVNNQVYFGKLHLGGDWARLTDIYYLQVRQQIQPPEGGQPQQNLQMVKLGGELHQPQDEMYIDRDKILFWENLKRDSQVVKFIEDFKAQQ